jgi:nucleotide-binding universal stress UspA family protein
MKILIAIDDFSEKSKSLVEKTTSLFLNALDSVWLLHVTEPDPEFVGYEVDPPIMRDQVAMHFHREHVQLQEMAGALRNKGVDATALLIQGENGKVIVQEAEKLMVDMIVVGSSEHGALHHFLLGDDTIKVVLNKSVRPVLVIPIPK